MVHLLFSYFVVTFFVFFLLSVYIVLLKNYISKEIESKKKDEIIVINIKMKEDYDFKEFVNAEISIFGISLIWPTFVMLYLVERMNTCIKFEIFNILPPEKE